MRVTVLAVVVLALVSPACTEIPPSTTAPTVIRLESASPGSFGAHLAEQYTHLSDIVEVKIVQPTRDPYDAIERGEADIMLGPADSAYFAYRRSAESRDVRPLRALATLQVVPIHLVVRDGTTIRSLEGLRGHRIGAGANSPMVELLLRALRLTEHARPTTGTAPLAEGTVDAMLITGYYPAPPVDAVTREGARLISIAGPAVDRLREDYPFIRMVTIPAHTYQGQSDPIYTIGAEVIYVCRSDLSEPVVYELTKRLFEALPVLAKSFSALRVLDVTQAAATVIPLHDGAARYYRELELLP